MKRICSDEFLFLDEVGVNFHMKLSDAHSYSGTDTVVHRWGDKGKNFSTVDKDRTRSIEKLQEPPNKLQLQIIIDVPYQIMHKWQTFIWTFEKE